MFVYDSPEYREVTARAEKLSLDDLRELTRIVGIKFQSNDVIMEDYLSALSEADDNDAVYAYLGSKGV